MLVDISVLKILLCKTIYTDAMKKHIPIFLLHIHVLSITYSTHKYKYKNSNTLPKIKDS